MSLIFILAFYSAIYIKCDQKSKKECEDYFNQTLSEKKGVSEQFDRLLNRECLEGFVNHYDNGEIGKNRLVIYHFTAEALDRNVVGPYRELVWKLMKTLQVIVPSEKDYNFFDLWQKLFDMSENIKIDLKTSEAFLKLIDLKKENNTIVKGSEIKKIEGFELLKNNIDIDKIEDDKKYDPLDLIEKNYKPYTDDKPKSQKENNSENSSDGKPKSHKKIFWIIIILSGISVILCASIFIFKRKVTKK